MFFKPSYAGDVWHACGSIKRKRRKISQFFISFLVLVNMPLTTAKKQKHVSERMAVGLFLLIFVP
jgi:hypothetical protein